MSFLFFYGFVNINSNANRQCGHKLNKDFITRKLQQLKKNNYLRIKPNLWTQPEGHTLWPNLRTNLGTQPWDPTMGPNLWTQPWGPTMGPNNGTQSLDPAFGPNHGTQPWDPASKPNYYQDKPRDQTFGHNLWTWMKCRGNLLCFFSFSIVGCINLFGPYQYIGY